MTHMKILALSVVGTLLLSGCGDEPKPEDAQSPASTAEETQTPAPGPKVAWEDEEKVLTLFAWPDYFAPNVIPDFEKQTGIKVKYATFTTAGEVDATLAKSPDKYDLIVASTAQVEANIAAKNLFPLVKDKLSNWKNLDGDLLKIVAAVDGDNQHAIPLLWGTAGVGFEYVKVRQALGRAPIEDSWKMAFDVKQVRLLDDCGVVFPNVMDEVVNAGLLFLGKSANTRDPQDYTELTQLFQTIKPYVKVAKEASTVDSVVKGSACVTLGWSPQLTAAASDSLREGSETSLFKKGVPVEGTMLWFDLMAVPMAAKHPGNAHRFLDHLMRPEVIAETSNYTGLANANAEALDLVDEMIHTDPHIYPSEKTLAHSYVHATPSAEVRKLRQTAWDALVK